MSLYFSYAAEFQEHFRRGIEAGVDTHIARQLSHDLAKFQSRVRRRWRKHDKVLVELHYVGGPLVGQIGSTAAYTVRDTVNERTIDVTAAGPLGLGPEDPIYAYRGRLVDDLRPFAALHYQKRLGAAHEVFPHAYPDYVKGSHA